MPNKLHQAITAIKAGDKATGRQLLAEALEADPHNEKAWLWMSDVMASDQHRKECLERVLAINPNNQIAQRALVALGQGQISQAAEAGTAPDQTQHRSEPPLAAQEPDETPKPPQERSSQPGSARVPHARSQRFIDYRYPTENRILALTFIAILIALLVFTPLTLGSLLVLSLVGFALNWLFVRARIEGLKRNAVRVSATQFPEIKALVDECAQHISIPTSTEVIVSYSPAMNAFATGVGKPYLIVLYSALVEVLDPLELKSVIGHEMGHIQFGHTTLLTIIGQLGSQSFGIPVVGDLIRYAFLFWMRASEFTADRAGLVACGRLDKAIATEVKLRVGPDLARRVDLRELARQAREAQRSFLGTLGEMESTHPMMITRIQKLVDFAYSDVFRQLRPDALQTDFEGSEHWQAMTSATQGPSKPFLSEASYRQAADNSWHSGTAPGDDSLSTAGQLEAPSVAYPPKSGNIGKLVIAILGGLLLLFFACSSCCVFQSIISSMSSRSVP